MIFVDISMLVVTLMVIIPSEVLASNWPVWVFLVHNVSLCKSV